MSECVVRMEMPKNCCECQLRQEDYDTGEEFCPFTGVECLSIGRQDNCPIICSLPEGHGRLIDADALIEQHKPSIFTTVTDFTEGQRSVVANIKNAPTIVTAEPKEEA